MKRTKKKVGRPPKRKGERLSKNRTFRVRGSLDEWLIAAAAESGRSVSEEIEHRLELSFQKPEKSVLRQLEESMKAAKEAQRAAKEAAKAAEEAKKSAAETASVFATDKSPSDGDKP